jgi:O-antigen ligase
VLGVACYALPYRSSKRKMVAFLGATIAVVGVVYIVVNNSTALSRLEASYATGDTSGRGEIFAAAIEMIAEKPLLGWRPVVWAYELGSREGRHYRVRDAHNLVLHLLLEVGLLGAVPFLIGLGLCVRAAWIARVRSLGLLPLAWLVNAIATGMILTPIRNKCFWLAVILSLASEASIIKQHKRKNLIVRSILQCSYKRSMNHG